MSFSAFMDAQQSATPPSSQAGGFGAFMDSASNPNQAATVQSTAVPASNGKGILTPTSFDSQVQAAKDRGLSAIPAAAGHEAVNFLKGGASAVKNLLGLVVGGATGAGVNAYEGITGKQVNPNGIFGQAEKFADAIPGAVAAIPGQVVDYGKSWIRDPKQAAYNAVGSIYEDPFNAALNVSGIGELAGSGMKVAGLVGDKAALRAATEAAGLTGTEAATASVLPGTMTTAGESLIQGSRAANPFNSIKGLYDLITSGGAKAVAGITGTGSETAKGLASVSQGDQLAMKQLFTKDGGMKKAQGLLEKSLNSIDTANPYGIDSGSLRQDLYNVADQFGMKPNVMSQSDLAKLEKHFELSDALKAGEKVNAAEYVGAADLLEIAKRYGISDGTPTFFTRLENSLRSPRRIGSQTIPPQSELEAFLKPIYERNGLVGMSQGGRVPQSVQQKIYEAISDAYSLGGTSSQGATAQRLQDLKGKLADLYDITPKTGGEKTGNAATTVLKKQVDATLRELDPGYGPANEAYQRAYGVQAAKDAVGNGVGDALKQGNIPGFLRSVGATAAIPASLAGSAVAGSTIAPALSAAAGNPGLAALLQLLAAQRSQQPTGATRQ